MGRQWCLPMGSRLRVAVALGTQKPIAAVVKEALVAAKDVVRNNFPYLHRRIWAHSVVARRLFSQLNGASCA